MANFDFDKFNGTLIYIGKVVNASEVDYTPFPHNLMAKESYQSTPLQRTELKAYRDTKNKLHRVSVSDNTTSPKTTKVNQENT